MKRNERIFFNIQLIFSLFLFHIIFLNIDVKIVVRNNFCKRNLRIKSNLNYILY